MAYCGEQVTDVASNEDELTAAMADGQSMLLPPDWHLQQMIDDSCYRSKVQDFVDRWGWLWNPLARY